MNVLGIKNRQKRDDLRFSMYRSVELYSSALKGTIIGHRREDNLYTEDQIAYVNIRAQ